jgi:hypothetical protein
MRAFVSALMLVVGLSAEANAFDAPAPRPSAEQLFEIVTALRSADVSGHAEDPRYFSRSWLEQSIGKTNAAVDQPEVSGLNWVKDSFLASMNVVSTIERVYSYSLVHRNDAGVALQMQTFGCSKPGTLILTFLFEEGAWRISGSSSDTTREGTSWYRAELVPIKRWPAIPQRDRSRYFNESTLGKTLGLNVKRSPCE